MFARCPTRVGGQDASEVVARETYLTPVHRKLEDDGTGYILQQELPLSCLSKDFQLLEVGTSYLCSLSDQA